MQLVSAHAVLQSVLLQEVAAWAALALRPFEAGPMPQYAFYDIWVARDAQGHVVSKIKIKTKHRRLITVHRMVCYHTMPKQE